MNMKTDFQYKDSARMCFYTAIGITILLLLSAMLTGCSSTKKLPVTINKHDNVRIETRYIKWMEKDTVYLKIPVQTAERTTADSTSHLENDFAVSDARINADGTLYHDLNTKPQEKPVPTEKMVERKDSIVYVEKNVEVPVPVEKELGWWEQTCIKWFPVSIPVIVTLLLAIMFFVKKYR